MKHTLFILLLGSVVLGCSESSTKKSSSSSTTNTYCSLYPHLCGTTSGTTSGSTTGTTTGGSSGGNYNSIPDQNNLWTARYNGPGKPTAPTTVNCSAPQNQPGGPNYSPRKGTIHMAFRKDYLPNIPGLGSYSTNVSYFLTNVDSAKGFLDSDGLLKVRFMPRPQRVPAAGDEWCHGRKVGSGSGTAYGYTELSYSVGVYGIQSGALVGPLQTHYLVTSIQTCSPAINFTGLNQSYPEGIVLAVYDVQSNQGCANHPCTGAWSEVSTTCWGMDIEVATDTTQTFQ